MTYNQWVNQTQNQMVLEIKNNNPRFWDHLLNAFYDFEFLYGDNIDKIDRAFIVSYENVLPKIKLVDKLINELDNFEFGITSTMTNDAIAKSNGSTNLKYRGYLVNNDQGNFESSEINSNTKSNTNTTSLTNDKFDNIIKVTNSQIMNLWGGIENEYKKLFQQIYGVN